MWGCCLRPLDFAATKLENILWMKIKHRIAKQNVLVLALPSVAVG